MKALAFILCLLTGMAANAQLCRGSLGDAVVNMTFGSGVNLGQPLAAGTTTYRFVNGDCPNDGDYTIISSTTDCFNSSWHRVPEDHTTGDANGYMMLVNASFDAGDFYIDTVKGLCTNTTYEFGAWIVNVLRPGGNCSPAIHPNLVFNIETATGVILGTYATGDIPETGSPGWRQYGLFFTTPANSTTVVIRLTNKAPGGCGNDLALDDITFRPCGPEAVASIVNATETVIDFCEGSVQPVNLKATVGAGYTSAAVQWQTSVNNGVTWADIPGATAYTYLFNLTAPGIYQYRLSAAEGSNITISNCRVASNNINITIHKLPAAAAVNNGPSCDSSLAIISGSGGGTYSWTGPSGFTSTDPVLNFVAVAAVAGQYNLIVADAVGCTATASTILIVNPATQATVSPDITICEGNVTTLSANGGINYEWSPATGLNDPQLATVTAGPTKTTTYYVVATNAFNCKDTATATVFISRTPKASAGPDKVLIKGNTVELNGTATGTAIRYYWTPTDFLNNAGLKIPVTEVPHDTIYVFHVESEVGCGTDEDSVQLKVYDGLFVPNSFTPNADASNDTWEIKTLTAYPTARLIIFNRDGRKVFESVGGYPYWDGTFKGQAQDPGTYVYMIDLQNNTPIRKGWVVLIR